MHQRQNHRPRHGIFIMLLVFSGACALFSAAPHAQAEDSKTSSKSPSNAHQACDTGFMNQMTGRAILESQREVISAEAMILKPDSVLEYACADQGVATTAKTAGPLFGESKDWHNIKVPINGKIKGVSIPNVDFDVYMGDTHLDKIVEKTTMEVLKDYVDSNFSHDFLGGADAGHNSEISNTVDNVSNVCDSMYSTFHISKCSDFGLEAPFMTFQELTTVDPRTLPESCPNPHGITQEALDLANNKDGKTTSLDKIDTYLPQVRSAAEGCAPPIPAGGRGQHIERGQDLFGNPIEKKKEDFPAMICPNPGCHLNKEATECLPAE